MPHRIDDSEVKLHEVEPEPVTEDDVGELADGDSFQRGLSYYRQGRIFDPVRRELAISAFCEGSSGGPYRVQATLAAKGAGSSEKITGWDCECPRGDFCKHIVALLLTWVHKRDTFEKRPTIAQALASKSREELIALISKMVEAEPDLVDLIALPVPEARKEEGGEIDQAALRRRVVAIVERVAGDYNGRWIPPAKVAHELDKLKAIGDEYARTHRWREAWKVYEALAEEAYETALEMDDEGEIQGFLAECSAGLAECLAHADGWDSDDRLGLIKSLYTLWKRDIEYGGIDISVDADDAMVEYARPDEREMVEGWLSGEMAPGGSESSRWRSQSTGEFLIRLKAKGGAGDEEILRQYQSLGLYESAIDFLLDRGRVDEAIALAAQKLDTVYDILRFAGELLLLGGERREQAFKLVEDRVRKEESAGQGREAARCLEWLADQYAAHGMIEKALALRLRLFETAPSDTLYFTIKYLAQTPPYDASYWLKLRPKLIATLEQRQNWGDLVDIYVEEGEARPALDALGKMKDRSRSWFYGGTSFEQEARVAEIATEPFPDESIRIYQDIAAKLIDQRNRGAYAMAAGFLKKACRIYERLGREQEWSAYIQSLRTQYKSLRALKEELTLAGLD